MKEGTNGCKVGVVRDFVRYCAPGRFIQEYAKI